MYFDLGGKFAISTYLIMFADSSLATRVAGEIFWYQLVVGLGSIIIGSNVIYIGISLITFKMNIRQHCFDF